MTPFAALVLEALREPAVREALAEVVSEVLPANEQPDAPVTLLDRAGLARALVVSPQTVDRLRGRPAFPELRVGDAPRFELAAVVRWLRADGREGLALVVGGKA